MEWIKFLKVKLSKVLIKKYLSTEYIGKNINIISEIDSTNEWAKREILIGGKNGSVFLAERQKNGRGKLGSEWESEGNNNILMSVVIDFGFKIIPNDITLMVGLCVEKSINSLYNCNATVKWPNDIFINQKKVCGILCESIKRDLSNILIIGVGINVNAKSFSNNLENTATSLYLLLGREIEREELISEILNNLEIFMEFDRCKIIKEYKQKCISIGKAVEADYEGKRIEGIIIDISNNGELLIKCKNDECVMLNSVNKVKQKL